MLKSGGKIGRLGRRVARDMPIGALVRLLSTRLLFTEWSGDASTMLRTIRVASLLKVCKSSNILNEQDLCMFPASINYSSPAATFRTACSWLILMPPAQLSLVVTDHIIIQAQEESRTVVLHVRLEHHMLNLSASVIM